MSIFSWVKSLFVKDSQKGKSCHYVWENPPLPTKKQKYVRRKPLKTKYRPSGVHRRRKNAGKRRTFKAKNKNPGVLNFINSEIVFNPKLNTGNFDLYNHYVKCCINNGESFLHYNGFFHAFHYHGRKEYMWTSRAGGVRSLVGVGLKNKIPRENHDQLELGI